MNKSFITLLVAVSFFVLLTLNSKIEAQNNNSAIPTPTKTPKRKESPQINKMELDKYEVIYICPYSDFCGKDENFSVKVKTTVNNPKNKSVIYQYTVSSGRIIGQGENVIWDLKNSLPGDYTITIAIGSEHGFNIETKTEKVTVKECPQCDPPCVCPAISMSGYQNVRADEIAIFSAKVSGGTVNDITYKWTISQGEIIEGQKTSEITIKINKEMRGYVKVSVEIGGSLCPTCSRTESRIVEIIK